MSLESNTLYLNQQKNVELNYNEEKVSSLFFSKVNSSRVLCKCNCWCYLTSICILLLQAVIQPETSRKIQVKETMFLKKNNFHLTLKSGEICSYASLTSSSKPSNDKNSKPSHAIYLIISIIAIQNGFSNISFEFFLMGFQLLLLIKGHHQHKQYFFISSATAFHILENHTLLFFTVFPSTG